MPLGQASQIIPSSDSEDLKDSENTSPNSTEVNEVWPVFNVSRGYPIALSFTLSNFCSCRYKKATPENKS